MSADKQRQTWREQRIGVYAGEQTPIYFNDTTPNHVLISNSSASSLYLGLNGNVSQQSYDMVIPPYATRLYASMLPQTRVYLYNSGTDKTDVVVKSWDGEFNPAAIAQSLELVGAGANGLLGIVEINNILSPLPPGNNVIGGVAIAEYAVPLPIGNNKIGRVDVDKIPNHAANYKKVTGTVDEVVVVKLDGGVVYKVVSDKPITIYDGPNEAWATGDFKSDVGLSCTTNISLKFTEAATAFILYH